MIDWIIQENRNEEKKYQNAKKIFSGKTNKIIKREKKFNKRK